MTTSSGGIRVPVGNCQVCGGEDKILTAKCKRCGKRACEKIDCQKAILSVANCRVPKMFLP